MAWVTPQFSKGRVDAAGRVLITPPQMATLSEPAPSQSGSEEDLNLQTLLEESHKRLDHSLDIINNWRSSHAYPLQCIKMALLKRSRRIDPQATVAQRLKRLISIYYKLSRFQDMSLSRMHDIGGCRSVVKTAAMVRGLVDACKHSYAKHPDRGPELVREYDYIQSPKSDGYRGIHLVYKYRSDAEHRKCFNGLRVEMQVRSRPQHAWATTVEIVSMFTGQALKSSAGEDQWKRFFALMGTAIALREGCSPVAGTPGNLLELAKELKELERKLCVRNQLAGWTASLNRFSGKAVKGVDAFLLTLDTNNRFLTYVGYTKNELKRAYEDYLSAEKGIEGKHGIQVVLVSAGSAKSLRVAYPNYFLDSRQFVSELDLATSHGKKK